MQAASPVLSLSPSFNNCSSANLADIAARVVEEFRHESDINDWEPETESLSPGEQKQGHDVNDEDEDDGDGEFEFAFVCRRPDSPISADEIFFNGQIKPVYPLFDTTLLLDDTPDHQNPVNDNSKSSKKTHRLPLGKLMSENRETTTSCSSSEADELDSLQPGTYCVLTPAKGSAAESPGRCKKSNSTGFSKRWKFRNLLYRSNSDSKDRFMFLAPHKKNSDKSTGDEEKAEKGKVKGGKVIAEEHYVKNRAVREDDKKRSYLPFRQDVVGIRLIQ